MDATLCTAIRRAHDFLTVGAAHPLQMAAAKGMGFPISYYEGLAADYQARRDANLIDTEGFRIRLRDAPGGLLRK